MFLPPAKPHVPKTAWFLGLDLAQRQDFTALATVQLAWTITGHNKATWEQEWTPSLIIRSLDRYELAQSYTAYQDAVQDRVNSIRAFDATSKIHLALDAAGPGAPVIDDLRSSNIDARVHPITITGGAHPAHSTHGANVPRRALVSRALLLIERGTLQAQPGLDNWSALREELLRLRAGDSHSKAHDDLAIALTLAVWQAATHAPEILPQRTPRPRAIMFGTRRLL
jgi:hypothetical protein